MKDLLKKVHIFSGLTDDEMDEIVGICHTQILTADEMIVEQNSTGKDVYIVQDGSIEVFVTVDDVERPIVFLGHGQLFGEMALLDHGYRSASGRAGAEGCTIVRVNNDEFTDLCADHPSIGYSVMKHFAIDLAFKLRHMNLTNA
ncbi:MAG: cyclic nucleotide-binding domain-containing protein [Chloroflexota bacterium]